MSGGGNLNKSTPQCNPIQSLAQIKTNKKKLETNDLKYIFNEKNLEISKEIKLRERERERKI